VGWFGNDGLGCRGISLLLDEMLGHAMFESGKCLAFKTGCIGIPHSLRRLQKVWCWGALFRGGIDGMRSNTASRVVQMSSMKIEFNPAIEYSSTTTVSSIWCEPWTRPPILDFILWVQCLAIIRAELELAQINVLDGANLPGRL
jgi:hypothetical protein